MKIAAYEVRRDEQKDFAFIAEKLGVELTETEDNLTLENIDTVNGAEGVTTLGRTRFDRALLTAVKERGVKYISTRTIGADHIDLTAAKELGLKVCNSNYAPNGVADYTVMLILLSLRKYKPALWRAQVNDYSLAGLQGRELRNLTVGILGTGKIGAAVIKNLSGFGCRILASDIRDFVNAETIAKMKDGVTIINCARGELMNIPDMIRGIETQKIGALALDVFDKEDGIYHENRRDDILSNRDMAYLRQFPNVIMTQHMAFYTDAAVQSMVFCGIEGLCDFAKTGHTATELV